MSDHKMLERVLAHSTQISWAEQEAIIRHCLYSQDENDLLAWFKDADGDELQIHLAGRAATPVLLEVDPEGPITVVEGISLRDAFARPDDPYSENDIVFQLSKSEAIRIMEERNDSPVENLLGASLEYAGVMNRRFSSEPFVHLSIGTRALPIKVPFATF